MKVNEYYQQGDVLITRVNNVQGNKIAIKPLAEGETTGHSHRISVTDKPYVEMYENNGVLFVKTSKNVTIEHEEHKPIVIEPGEYQIGIVREYDYWTEEVRSVQD